MEACEFDLDILEGYGNALSYPNAQLPAQLARLSGRLPYRLAKEELAQFRDAAAALGMEALEEQYTRAFDLGPQAVPYLSVHLFGAESPQRGQYMAGLSGAYAAAGFDAEGELPDHLGVVLRYARVAPPDEWLELRQWCLPAPIRNMRLALEKSDNVYQHLLASLESFLAMSPVEEPSHA